MSNIITNSILDRYAKVLCAIEENIISCGIYNHSGDQLASYSPENENSKPCVEISGESIRDYIHKEVDTLYKVNNEVSLYGTALEKVQSHGDLHLIVVFNDKSSPELNQRIKSVSDYLKDCLDNEHQLSCELNGMANDLASRHEELNLLYSINDHIYDFKEENNTLKSLLVNCVNFLDVDMTVLLLPEKNIEISYSAENPVHQKTPIFIERLKNILIESPQKLNQSIVVNDHLPSTLDDLKTCVTFKFICCPIYNEYDNVIGVVISINNTGKADFTNSDRSIIDEIAKKTSKIIQYHYDSLTGLVKRYGFESYLEDSLYTTKFNNLTHFILKIDIDRLRLINDMVGSDAGDLMIKNVANIIRLNVGKNNIISRVGGNGFWVLLLDCPEHYADTISEKIRHEISSLHYEWEDNYLEVSASIGMYEITLETRSIIDALSASEMACNTAKELGGNCIQQYQHDNADLNERKNEMLWAGKLQSAIKSDEMVLYRQAISPTNNEGNDTFSEILVRMYDKQGKVIGPDNFIPAAERYHLMKHLDRWVISQAFMFMSKQYSELGPSMGIYAINLSGHSLGDESILEYIISTMQAYKLPPSKICFEVTETATISNMDSAINFIRLLKNHGCLFSLDDFGTGFSSFSYLKNLPVDFIKIDGSFVENITEDPFSLAIVKSIIYIARSLNIKTIAEKISEEKFYLKMKEMGVDYFQGYFIHMPEPLNNSLQKRKNRIA